MPINITEVINFCMGKFPNDSSLAEKCFLELVMGHQELQKMKVLGTVVYAVIFCTGIFGNISTCIVIRKHRLLKTTTNTYLFNLAVADLVTLLTGLPFEVYMVWHPYPWEFPAFFCHFKAWCMETTCYASVLTILAFSIERYLAVCHSFSFMKYRLYHRRLFIILVVVWLAAGICAAPFGVYHVVEYLIPESPFSHNSGPIEDSRMCVLAFVVRPDLTGMFEILFHMSALVFFVIPMSLLLWIYRQVFLVVKQSRRKLLRSTKSVSMTYISSNTHDYHSRKVLWILVTVVGVFFCCYAPFQLQRLLFSYVPQRLQSEINNYLFWISGFLFYLSATLNPIMYNVISPRYRRAFVEILSCTQPPEDSNMNRSPKFSTAGQQRMLNRSNSTDRKARKIRRPNESADLAWKKDTPPRLKRQKTNTTDLIVLDNMAAYDVLL